MPESNSHSAKRWLPKFSIGVVLVAILGASVYLFQQRRSPIPFFKAVDVASNGSAAEVLSLSGGIQIREQGGKQRELKPGDSLRLGSHIVAEPGASAELRTNAQILIGLGGEGNFVFEEARANEDRSIRTSSWYVGRGRVRAKIGLDSPSENWRQLKAPSARVLGKKGEVGLRIPLGGGGQVWGVGDGVDAQVEWEDGRKLRLSPGVMEYL